MIAAGKGKQIVELILDISLSGRAARQNPSLFALAICARCNDEETKKMAYDAFNQMCRIPTHLFMFVKYCESCSSGTGWGRAHKNAIINWYLNKCKNPVALARLLTKYKNREGWTHRDVIRLAHPKPNDDTLKVILRFIMKGFVDAKMLADKDMANDEKITKMLEFLEVTQKAKICTDEDELVQMIKQHGLEREHLPTQLLNSKEVWKALVNNLKMEAIIRNLGKISSMELCSEGSLIEKEIVNKLTDQKALKDARTHPFKVLLALTTYEKGKGEKGHLNWVTNKQIMEALDKAYYLSFAAVEPTGKRYLLAIDVSGSMQAPCVGSQAITCKIAAAAMMMVTARTEANCDIVAFSHELMPMKIAKTDTLPQVLEKTKGLPFGGTDCALPMLWADENKKKYDVFIVYTDSETWYGKVHPSRALQDYRRNMGIHDAKLIVVGMASNGFSIADPEDLGMLDIVGFDSAATQTIAKFSLGEI